MSLAPPGDPSPLVAVIDRTPVALPASARPQVFVVVDTEEEFDWGAPFSRENTSVTAIRALEHFQPRLDRYGVKPTYVIDYPVATRPESYPVIRALLESGRCAVGAHLHPWVTPPFEEEVTPANSFACNLGEPLEGAKLVTLTRAIEQHVGVRPVIYKAGRYGLGPSTVRVLERQGFEIDTSVNPLMDYRGWHGPDFEAYDARPFFFGRTGALLEVPCTTGFAGRARRLGRALHRLAERPALRRLRAAGILRRTGLLDRIMLSPETSTFAEMKAVTEALLDDGVRTFALTFHSPSVEPGHTPYVRSDADLKDFVGRIDSYLDFFLGPLGGVPSSLQEFRASLFAGGAAA